MEIGLKNRKHEIIGHVKVSEIDYDLLNNYKWHKTGNYVSSKINGKELSIHRFIIIHILKNELTPKQQVDHINNDPYDNTRENLRVVTPSENSRNKKKKEGLTSQYTGVSKTNNNNFIVKIRIKNKRLSAYYTNEIHAAAQYNLWVDEYKLTTSVKNNIDTPNNFIEWKPRQKQKDNLPEGIRKSKNKFQVRITSGKKETSLGTYDTLEEAINIRKKAEEKRRQERNDTRMALPILLNEQGLCYFSIKDVQIIIDQDLFHDLMKYSWNKTKKNYIQGEVNGKPIQLSRYIMNCPENLVVDHINNNPLDNRKCNLRIVTLQENSFNRSSQKNSTSQYVGVSKKSDRNKWVSVINGKFLGYFDDEIEAAKARDTAVKKYYKGIGKLNFPEN